MLARNSDAVKGTPSLESQDENEPDRDAVVGLVRISYSGITIGICFGLGRAVTGSRASVDPKTGLETTLAGVADVEPGGSGVDESMDMA